MSNISKTIRDRAIQSIFLDPVGVIHPGIMPLKNLDPSYT